MPAVRITMLAHPQEADSPLLALGARLAIDDFGTGYSRYASVQVDSSALARLLHYLLH